MGGFATRRYVDVVKLKRKLNTFALDSSPWGKIRFSRSTTKCESSKEQIVPLTQPIQHAEGPFCDIERDILYYVDTFQATAYRYNLLKGTTTSYKLKGHDSVGVVIPIADAEDEFIVGADRVLYRMKWTCQNLNTIYTKLIQIEEDKPKNQFNDGKVDRLGRLWLGTLTRNKDLTVAPDGGNLYMFKPNDLKNHQVQIMKTSISNGMAWSSDFENFYFIDTAPGQVYSYKYEEISGDISCKQVIFDMKDHPHLKGLPDGMTIDTNDNLWIALFGGHSIINLDPRTKTIIREVQIPATYVTSACFGGKELDILFVTTSRLHLNEAQLKNEKLAGAVFAVSNLGVKGREDHRYNQTC